MYTYEWETSSGGNNTTHAQSANSNNSLTHALTSEWFDGGGKLGHHRKTNSNHTTHLVLFWTALKSIKTKVLCGQKKRREKQWPVQMKQAFTNVRPNSPDFPLKMLECAHLSIGRKP